MKRIKMIRFGTLTIFLIAMTIVSFMLLADMSTNNITVAMAALILLAVASGLFIPSVLLSWMVVLILAAGIFCSYTKKMDYFYSVRKMKV
ncbi:MAG: hypothetical protein ABF773_14815, partial [Lentilactobacillus hilgardii]|uniref:hypothetical protein n=1 Tax=Lactobacillaceae TaxID=33958 RepID=UPI0039E72DBF